MFYSKESQQTKNRDKKVQEALNFRYGNYHQYYGYRNQGTEDSRLQCMKRDWFYMKNVLDIGCNAGHFTLSIARDFEPKSVVGIDIDSQLVRMAKKNVRHYINYGKLTDRDFPLSLVLNYGPVAQAIDPKCRFLVGTFPFNVQFIQGNYVAISDEMLEWQEPFFDTILCLSLTKWIHLNWGDEGIRKLFHRAYAHLNPGGHMILETQAYESYAKKKKITEETYQHYRGIQLFPHMFNEYLIKEVGFESCELIDTPAHSSKGFSRPIYLFKKGNDVKFQQRKPKHVFYDSNSSFDDSDVEQLSE